MASRVAGATVRAVARKKPVFPSKAALTLTQPAVAKIKCLMQEKPDMAYSDIQAGVKSVDPGEMLQKVGLRIGVKTRGCNGLTYTLDYAKPEDKGKFDEVVEQDGVKVIIDSKAQLTLLGTEMDYVENKLSTEFIFNNPNIKGTCGCGESFNV